jgi:hypothetical protein
MDAMAVNMTKPGFVTVEDKRCDNDTNFSSKAQLLAQLKALQIRWYKTFCGD